MHSTPKKLMFSSLFKVQLCFITKNRCVSKSTSMYLNESTCSTKYSLNINMYSGEHGISHTNLYVIKKKLSSLSFVVIIINHHILIMNDVSPKLSRKCRQYLILIKLCRCNVQCVRDSVLATVLFFDHV
jgi:hypothetical protein